MQRIVFVFVLCLLMGSVHAQEEISKKPLAVGMDMQPFLKEIFSDGASLNRADLKLLWQGANRKYTELDIQPSFRRIDVDNPAPQKTTSFGLGTGIEMGYHLPIEKKWLLGFGWRLGFGFESSTSKDDNAINFERISSTFDISFGPALNPTFKLSDKIWLRTKMTAALMFMESSNEIKFSGSTSDKQKNSTFDISLTAPSSLVLLYFIR